MMNNNDDASLLNWFIDEYQKEVSIICNASMEQDTIDYTFRKAYKCLSEFVRRYYPNLQLVITPLSTSLLGDLSRGIMIPDVPIGIITIDNPTLNDGGKRCTPHELLQYILCYIGIVNNLENVSLSGMIKTITNEDPTRLYGYIQYDSEIAKTTFCGLNEKKLINSKYSESLNNPSEELGKAIKEISTQFDNAARILPPEYADLLINNKENTIDITPSQYDNIKYTVAKQCPLLASEKDKSRKEVLIVATHQKLCEKSNLNTSYYFFNQPFIRENGTFSNYGNMLLRSTKVYQRYGRKF